MLGISIVDVEHFLRRWISRGPADLKQYRIGQRIDRCELKIGECKLRIDYCWLRIQRRQIEQWRRGKRRQLVRGILDERTDEHAQEQENKDRLA